MWPLGFVNAVARSLGVFGPFGPLANPGPLGVKPTKATQPRAQAPAEGLGNHPDREVIPMGEASTTQRAADGAAHLHCPAWCVTDHSGDEHRTVVEHRGIEEPIPGRTA